MIQPLEAPEIAQIDSSVTKAERFWGHIPILGWTFASMMWGERTRPIVKKIERQLKSRSEPESGLWGVSAAKTALARYVCRVAAEAMGWPNDYFIPDDPAFNQTLGEVVEFLWVRQQAVHNQENVWPPAPRLLK